MAKLSVEQALAKAKSHTKKGELAEAQAIYAAILSAFPNNKKAQRGLTSLGGGKQSDTTQGPPQEVINQLMNLYNRGQLAEVLEHAQALTKQYPEAFDIWNILGASAAQTGKLDQAVRAFEKIISLKPEEASAYFNLGNALKDLGKLEEAIEAFTNALTIKPDYEAALNNLVVALKSQGQPGECKLKKALESYNKALAIKPENADIHFNRGVDLQAQGKLEEAIEAYTTALFLKPDDAEAYLNMGAALKEQGKLEEAIEAYNKALSRNPDYAEAYHNMGIVLRDQGKLEEAIEAYSKALAINPDDARTSFQKADLLHKTGNIVGAIESYRNSISDSLKSEYQGLPYSITQSQIDLLNGIKSPDFLPTNAMALCNFSDNIYIDYHKKRLASSRSNNKLVLIASQPKSGSSYLCKTLLTVSKMPLGRFCYKYAQNEHDLYLPNLCMHNEHGAISMQHTKATINNIDLVKLFDIRTIITVRNIYDTVASLYNNIQQGKIKSDEGSGYSFMFNSAEIRDLSSQAKVDFLIDFAVPWCINFYVSWVYYTREGGIKAKWLQYNEIMENWEQTTRDTLTFMGLDSNHSDIDLERLKEPVTSRFQSRNEKLNMEILSPDQKKKIIGMVSYYPDIDFSEYGFLDRTSDGQYAIHS